MLNEGAGVIGRVETWAVGAMGAIGVICLMLGPDGWYPSCHGFRSTKGMVMASHGTRGLLKQNIFLKIVSFNFYFNLHLCGAPESQGLHLFDAVSVVAIDPCKIGISQLTELCLSESARVRGAVIIKSITVLKPLELVTNNALKSWAYNCTII